ncbi:MAG: glycerophosphodiester phosphodiesterase [Vibrio sp.]
MLIIAHRGARATHPENTLLAFQAALDSGAQAIELDVHEYDGEFWVIHDKWLNRTTDHVGMLRWLSREKLAKVDAGQGEKIPSLRDVFALLNGQCALNIEVKGIQNFELLYQHMHEACEHYGFSNEQLILSSFNHHWLAKIKQAQPHLLIGALTGSKNIHKAQCAEQLSAVSINVDLDVIDQDYVDDAKSRGLKVYVYTVNHPQDWQWLHQIGVDGIFCDCPLKAIDDFKSQGISQPNGFTWR